MEFQADATEEGSRNARERFLAENNQGIKI
jgi:hypothetical protein